MKPVIDRMVWLAGKIADVEDSVASLSRFGAVRKAKKRQLLLLIREFELLKTILILVGGAV